MATPLMCERCGEPVYAFACAGGDTAVVDRPRHGLGMWALFGKLMLKIVPDNEPAVEGESVQESKLGGLIRYRAHDETCSKLPKPKQSVPPSKTKRTPIRDRRVR